MGFKAHTVVGRREGRTGASVCRCPSPSFSPSSLSSSLVPSHLLPSLSPSRHPPLPVRVGSFSLLPLLPRPPPAKYASLPPHSPAIVVPPGEVTISLSCPGCLPVSSTILALPRTVWAASVWATSRGRPAAAWGSGLRVWGFRVFQGLGHTSGQAFGRMGQRHALNPLVHTVGRMGQRHALNPLAYSRPHGAEACPQPIGIQ